MRVCVVGANHFVDDDRMLFREALTLSTRHVVEVIGWGTPHFRQRTLEDGVTVTPYMKRSKVRHIDLLVELYLHIRSGRFNVLHCFDLDSLLVAVLFSCFARRRPFIVYDAHEHFPSLISGYFTLPRALSVALEALLTLIENVLASSCDAFVVVNDILRRRFSAFGKPIVIVRNVPSLNWYYHAKIVNVLDDVVDPIVTYGGFLDSEKGLHTVIRAKATLDKRGIRTCFVLTGRIKELSRYPELAGKGFRVTGRVDYRDLPSFLRPAVVGLVLTSPTTQNYLIAQPSKLFTYMIAGLPVVASDLPEIRAIVSKEMSGVLVNPDDSEEIANAIAKLLEDEEMRVTMGKNARRAAEREYNWELESDNLFRLYDEIGERIHEFGNGR